MKIWPYSAVAAHRGGGILAPENTLAALLTGAFYGHTLVEFDVKLSKDNKVFLLHDDTLDRTSNGWGAVDQLTYADIASYDAGSWFAPQFCKEYIPTLHEVSSCCITHNLSANIEIKPTRGRETETGRLVALEAQKLWYYAVPPLFSSYSYCALKAAKEAVPEFPRGLLFDQVPDYWETLAAELGCLSLHINHHYLTKSLAHQIKAAGYALFVFTVNDVAEAKKLRHWGADCICTNQIDRLTTTALLRSEAMDNAALVS
jgi:glycerophosphoryl diester phosphodiesterase